MDIENLTVGQIREISKLAGGAGTKKVRSHSFVVGQQYLIRTVTMIQVGKLEAVTSSDLLLSGASWIADTGRFGACLATGVFFEVEKMPGDGLCIVGRGAIVDAFPWSHKLPEETK